MPGGLLMFESSFAGTMSSAVSMMQSLASTLSNEGGLRDATTDVELSMSPEPFSCHFRTTSTSMAVRILQGMTPALFRHGLHYPVHVTFSSSASTGTEHGATAVAAAVTAAAAATPTTIANAASTETMSRRRRRRGRRGRGGRGTGGGGGGEEGGGQRGKSDRNDVFAIATRELTNSMVKGPNREEEEDYLEDEEGEGEEEEEVDEDDGGSSTGTVVWLSGWEEGDEKEEEEATRSEKGREEISWAERVEKEEAEGREGGLQEAADIALGEIVAKCKEKVGGILHLPTDLLDRRSDVV